MMRSVLVILFAFISVFADAQLNRNDFNQKFLEANQLMEEKLWNQSIDLWQELYASDSLNGNVMYKMGVCYLQTANDKLKSLPYLLKASDQTIAKSYDLFDAQEKRPPVEVYYYLGRAYHLNYEMDKSIASYNKMLENTPEKHHLHTAARRQIEMCEEAKIQVANPQNYIITNLGPKINTAENEYSPVISLDESAMFYTSRRLRRDSSNLFFVDPNIGEYLEDIYVSYKDIDGNWMESEMLEISGDGHEATIGVSADGQSLYVYVDEGGDGGIMRSDLVGESWSEPVKLSANINTSAWETHATVTPDKQTLYFVSSKGSLFEGEDRDIFKSVKLPNGDWSKALNVGAGINSKYDEESPFISADGKTIYFSSKGHNSMGGFDIFYSTMSDDGVWSEPKNIGYPLNTVDDDVFFVPTANGKRAYYSSEKEEGYGLKDIYMIELPDSPVETDLAVLKGYIFPPEGNPLPDETVVRVTNKNTGEITEYRPRQRDGAYVAILPPCIAYKIDYLVNGEIIHQEMVNVPCEAAYTEINKEIKLLPVYLGGEVTGYDAEVTEQSGGSDVPVVFVPDGEKDAVSVIVNNDAGTAEFERYFIYDFHEFNVAERRFAEFVSGISSIIDKKGSAEITVESSASRVPSSRFKSNQALADYRNETATDQIREALLAAGYTAKQFSFETPKKLVQGPAYQGDALANRKTYEQYQYVRVTVK